MATKADIGGMRAEVKSEAASVRADLKSEIASIKSEIVMVRNELKSEIAAVRNDLQSQFASVRADLKSEATAVKAELHEVELRMTIKLSGLIMAATGILLAAIKFVKWGLQSCFSRGGLESERSVERRASSHNLQAFELRP